MGDESTSLPKGRLLQQKPKIIIRKCKKRTSTKARSSRTELKKVNGEVVDVNKASDDTPLVVESPKELSVIKTNDGLKRKLPEITDDDAVVILDRDSVIGNEKDEDGNDFKGFKKRMITESEGVLDSTIDIGEQGKSDSQETGNINPKQKIVKLGKGKKKSKLKKGEEGSGDDGQGESQTEYAQYLGLQPTMQFKCYRCSEKGFPSLLALNMHQRGCGNANKSNFIANLQQDMPPSDPNMLTNFRITRKVYLCSACGTYYENWNLFLHMRDVHKKHICLICLTMFGIADKLADHLKTVHSIHETTFKTSEEFQKAYKGSCYLICCSCENMFSEREDHFKHNCVKKDPTAKCSLCGVKCGHYYNCPNNSNPRPITGSENCSQITVARTQPGTAAKLSGPGSKKNSAEEPWMGKKGQGEGDYDYDVSDAASFCHVDLADDAAEKENRSATEGTEDNPVEISDNDTLTADESTDKISQPTRTSELDKNLPTKEKTEKIASVITEADNTSEPQDGLPEKDTNTSEDLMKQDELSNINLEGDNIITRQDENPSIQHATDLKDTNKTVDERNDNESMDESNGNNSVDGSKDESVDGSKENESMDEGKDDDLIGYCKDNESVKSKDNDSLNKSKDGEITNKEKPLNGSPNLSIQPTDDDATNTNLVGQEKPQLHQESDKDNSNSSESDGDLDTHKSVASQDSDSSAESSAEESQKDSGKQSAESKTNISECENSDDNTSKIEDEQPSSVNNSFEDKEYSGTNQPTSSLENSESAKDFHLVDGLQEEKESENEMSSKVHEEESQSQTNRESKSAEDINDGILLAGEDVPAMALTLEDRLEEASASNVVKECVRTSCQNCVYCSHAIKIAVNGKQLALHLLAEHRYKPIKNNETSHDVVTKLKTSLTELEPLFFNTDSYDSSDKSLSTTYDYTYECFQCRFVTKVHKELYVHKRKMHQKTVLLCVMCKANFYSYSELLCHMCPGVYVSEDINFRCCFCDLDMIPSAFRLMVHLRKSHHTCDICLEVAGDQQKLSTHMWKHKLNHLCYRCGIAYRNKPDITKHLFWKHGTESVLCKKCLQKKWPHVYHFCIPPTVFICEECNVSFTKAVALKVHKRLHSGELPYTCSICEQRFISKKLMTKHENVHYKPPVSKATAVEHADSKHESTDEHINVESIDEPNVDNTEIDGNSNKTPRESDVNPNVTPETKTKKKKKKDKDKKSKHIVDVYNLPPLNLSSESDSSDDEGKNRTSEILKENLSTESKPPEILENVDLGEKEDKTPEHLEDNQVPAPVVDGVWDSFHTYKAELEKRESKDLSLPNILPTTSESLPNTKVILPDKMRIEPEETPVDIISLDHSYCLIPGKPKSNENEEEDKKQDQENISEVVKTEELEEDNPAPRGHSSSIDHAYATLNTSSAEGVTASAAPPEPVSIHESPKTPPQAEPQDENNSSSKKKQKTPKKKKNNTTNSCSSSSDSSSDTDSSTCTCGTNCSCTSSSSNTSSTSSSDSDSSTSEGRRRSAIKKEKKRERHKHQKEETTPAKTNEEHSSPQKKEDEPVASAPLEPVNLPIRESDLDTDESSTDEDFYDKYPQSHAKQQLEKRNKLLLLASVAPVNNGTTSPPLPPPEPEPEPPVPPPPPPSSSKKKIKTKRRRKSQQNKKSVSKTRSHVPAQPTASVSFPNATSTPHFSSYQNLSPKSVSPLATSLVNFHSDTAMGSGSENESARLSKRKRVRNKFYGYSSEEEDSERPNSKWKKVEPQLIPQQAQLNVSFQPTLHRVQTPTVTHIKRPKPPSESSESDDEPFNKKSEFKNSSNSSSSSSESENEVDFKPEIPKEQTEKSDNLYCYCQCPYDEVSEMIACDGEDCTIEWFHFECVGIMVPPKGKWYCPDCRKRRDLM